MSYKIAYSIKKYNQDTKKTSFYKDVSEIFSQNILYKVDNFKGDFEQNNEHKIADGLTKFSSVYNKKYSSIGNQNFIITFSLLDENFFENINLELFKNHLFNILKNNFDILSFVVTKDSLDDVTFYVICTAIVKTIFLDHIEKKVIEGGKSLEDLPGVLSYNLILGGTLSEKPEEKFIKKIVNELNAAGNYNLIAASEIAKQQYILNSYNRAAAKINNLETDISTLFKILNAKNPKFKSAFEYYINNYNLNTLKDLIKK